MSVSRWGGIAAVLAALILVFVVFLVSRPFPGGPAARSQAGATATCSPAGVPAASRSPAGAAARSQALLLARLRTLPPAPRGYSKDAPKARQVLLSNRRVVIGKGREFPKTFSGLQTPSARGTVPYVVVCTEPVSDVTRAAAVASGAKVVGFLPANAMLVECTEKSLALLAEDASFAAVFEFEPTDKVQPGLVAGLEAAGARGSGAVTIITFDSSDVPAVAAAVKAAGGVVTASDAGGRGFVRANISAAALAALAARGDVHWMEKFSLPHVLNDVAVGTGLMDIAPVRDLHGLTGRGQTIAIGDSGIDTGVKETLVADFTGRVVRIVQFNTTASDTSGNTYTFSHTADLLGHGTHTAGSLAGSGAMSGGQFKGVAYEANLYVECGGADGGGNVLYFPDEPSAVDCYLTFQKSQFNYYIHSDSWGSPVAGAYDAGCVNLDTVAWKNPDLLPVFAAGNSGSGARTVISPGCAKNTLCVGASESLRSSYSDADNAAQIASFSSRGPCADGRTKPDIVAPGTRIVSVRSTKSSNTGWGVYAANTNYLYNNGTSMATPLTAGACALARQWLVERRGFTNELPTAALLKAIIMGGAKDLYGIAGAADSPSYITNACPNSNEGWGRVDLEQSLFPSNREVRLFDRIPFCVGSDWSTTVTTTNAAALDVQLVWIDYPATEGAAKALVNDLDLVVSNRTTGAVYLGNGGTVADDLNNVESVRITNAPAASYTVYVRGTATVPYASGSGGAAALYVRGAFASDTATPATVITNCVLTVSSGMDGLYDCSANPGLNVYTAGSTVVLTAGTYLVVTDRYGDAVSRHLLRGWTGGTGSVPAAGTSNSVAFVIATDSTICWDWNPDPAGYALTRYSYLVDYDSLYSVTTTWHTAGSAITISVPDSLPDGAETCDLSADGYGIERLGMIAYWLPSDSDTAAYAYDASGRMASSFDLALTNSAVVYFDYYDESTLMTNSYAPLPEWWFCKYLSGSVDTNAAGFAAADADGDGFTNYQEYLADTDPVDPASYFAIFGFCPTNLAWKGGVARTQVVERADSLSTNAAAWTGVYTNYPATPVTNFIALPFRPATNSFYRIRAL